MLQNPLGSWRESQRQPQSSKGDGDSAVSRIRGQTYVGILLPSQKRHNLVNLFGYNCLLELPLKCSSGQRTYILEKGLGSWERCAHAQLNQMLLEASLQPVN